MPDGLDSFRDRFPDCTTVTLDVNHRSHPGIIRVCNQLIAGPDRADGAGTASMLHDKEMKPHDPSAHADYPSVISVVGYDVDEEAAELADIVRFLARHRVISDYSQVALLLHSVKPRHSRPYQSALEAARIPVFCSDTGEERVRPSRHRGGLNSRFPKGRVCITTMHQSKGLEWPVTAVVCGGLVGKSNGWDHAIARYSRRKQHHRGALGAPLDQLRQFYVGCTRAENLLILSANQAISTGSGVRPHVGRDPPLVVHGHRRYSHAEVLVGAGRLSCIVIGAVPHHRPRGASRSAPASVGPPGLVHRQFQNNAPDDLHQRHWTVGLFVATVGHPVGGMGDGVFEEAASCGSLVIEPPVCRWAIANTRSRVV